jgi:glucose/arabinose dehydrogenase
VSEEAVNLAGGLEVPDGFSVTPVAENLPQVTQIDFTTAGDMLVSLQGGRIWRYRDTNGDGRYDERVLFATGFDEVVGLLYDPADDGVWVGGRGKLLHLLDSDGNGAADSRSLRVEGIAWGRHQNNGMAWNPDPDPFSGELGGTWLYFGLGSTDDLEVGDEINATILRFPRTGQSAAELETVSLGNRNAYDVLWANLPVDLNEADGTRVWQLFASENGPDFNDAPDEVNHIRWGHHYGFPDQFGPLAGDEVEGDPYSGPVYPATAHASANGLAYIDHPEWPAEYRTIYVALFGEVFNPVPVGHLVERVTLRSETLPNGELTYRGDPSPFITGLDRPLPLVTTPDGNMMVGDYATGVLYKIAYDGE